MRTRTGTFAAVAALLLTAAPAVAAAEPGPDGRPATGPAASAGFGQARAAASRSERAEAALAAAEGLFTDRSARARGAASSAAPVEATLVLRDLALSLDDLGPADRRTAERILARPTDAGSEPWPGVKYTSPAKNTCDQPGATTTDFCIHWVDAPGSKHAPPLTDTDADGVPDWVETNEAVFGEVWDRVVRDLGYRRPLGDHATAEPGPNAGLDIYLAELGQYDLYGYCGVDRTVDPAWQMPGYCVIDDDFAEHPGTPLNDLRVTAAHEFFHAVQFAYNWVADTWVMEGTAAWVEDEVYDGVNDNLSYLPRSAVAVPEMPLDYVTGQDGWQTTRYGSWIWWRFLTEQLSATRNADPTVVRQLWQRLDAGKVETMPALRRVVAARGATFGRLFADFGAANRVPARWYDEGRSYTRYVAPVPARYRAVLTRKAPSVRRTPRLFHLATRHATFRPGTSLKGTWRLRLVLDLPRTVRGSQAAVMVHLRSGKVRRQMVRLNRDGDGRVVVPFSRSTVSSVTLTLTNASTRIKDCWPDTAPSPFTCGGTPLDDDLPFTYTARAVR